MNPVFNPITVGLAIAAVFGFGAGVLIGTKFSGSFLRGLGAFAIGIVCVFLGGVFVAFPLLLWMNVGVGDFLAVFWETLRNWDLAAVFSAYGMIVGLPAFSVGYFGGMVSSHGRRYRRRRGHG